MKLIKKIFQLSFLATILLITSCKKNVTVDDNVVFEETIKGIKKQEPLSLNFNTSNNNKKVQWTVTPNPNDVTISSVNYNASFIFKTAGTYTIKAMADGKYAKYYITVIDEVYTNYGSDFNLIAPKFYGVKLNEELVFKAVNTTSNPSLAWSAFNLNYPSVSVTIIEDVLNHTATMSFPNPGLWEVTVKMGNKNIRRTVWVDDSNVPKTNDEVSFILNDKLILTPEALGNSLNFKATTTKMYHCTSDVILSYNVGNKLMIDYAGVSVSKEPCNPLSTASVTNSFKNIQVGTYPFTINYQNQTFSGTLSLDVNGNYTLDWKDRSVISFTTYTF